MGIMGGSSGRIAIYALAVGLVLLGGCGDDSPTDTAIPEPNPERDGCIPYEYYENGRVPCEQLIQWSRGALGMAVSDDLLLLATGRTGLQIMDVSGGGLGVILATVPCGDATRVSVDGDCVAVACNGDGFSLVDIADPLAPVHLVQRDVVGTGTYGGTAGQSWYIALHGNELFVAGNYHQIFRYDIRHPERPVLVETYEMGADGTALKIVGDLLYVGLRYVLDLSTSPMEVVAEIGEGDAFELCQRGGHLHAAQGDRLVTLDVTDPAAPFVVDRRTNLPANTLAASGDRVFVGGSNGDISVFDYLVPENPRLVTTFQGGVALRDLALHEGNLYLGGYEQLGWCDVADPAAPSDPILADIHHQRSLVRAGSALVVSTSLALSVYDVRLPSFATPAAVLNQRRRPSVTRMVSSGPLVYCMLSRGGWQVLDVVDPSAPGVSAVFDDERAFGAISVSGGRLALASQSTVFLYDLPGGSAEPTLAATWDSDENIHALHLDGNRLLLSLDRTQLLLLDVADPAHPDTLARDADNPFFCDSARIRWVGDFAIDFHGESCCGLSPAVPDGEGIFQRGPYLELGERARDWAFVGNVVYALVDRLVDSPLRYQTYLVASLIDPQGTLKKIGVGTVPMGTYSRIAADGEFLYALHESGVDRFYLDCRSFD